MLRENLLLGIGHPLLDITAKVDTDFLKKYDLKQNDATVISTEKHRNLYKELKENYEIKYSVGGSIQNTLRILQWILEIPKISTFFGSTGNDDLSRLLYEKATSEGVNTRYQYIEKKSTGTCIVLINGENRSLCTNWGSSQLFNLDHLNTPENKKIVETAEYYYMGGFFLNVCQATVFFIAKMAAKNNRQCIFNLSAPFIILSYKETLMELLQYTDIIFGNTSEIETLAATFKLNASGLEDAVLSIANWPKINKARSRIVVITQGDKPVIVSAENKLNKFSVPKIPKEKIMDTNGAGDAFVGGFLSQYIQGKNINCCIECGIWAALEIIQRIGCTFDKKANFKMS